MSKVYAPKVYTDLIISTIVDFFSELLPAACLYGLDNFYYRRYTLPCCPLDTRLYGLDNFYYRRFGSLGSAAVSVYTDLIISTIVDSDFEKRLKDNRLYGLDNFYYRRFHMDGNNYFKGLYGLDNFYYRRCFGEVQPIMVYTDLIISTIVDQPIAIRVCIKSIRT